MYKLVLLQSRGGSPSQKEFILKEGKNVIGRTEESDIHLDSEFISKRHALITITGSEMVIEDLKSRNGTFVNGVMVQTAKLKTGDRISFQDIILELCPAAKQKIRQPAPGSQLLSKWDQFQKTIHPYLEKMAERIEWKYLTMALFLLFIVTSFLVTVPPAVTQMQTKIQTEAIKRAEFIVKRIARENQKYFSIQNNTVAADLLNLSTSVAEDEERILSVLIVDPKTKRILAPAEKLNQTIDESGPILRGTEAAKLLIAELDPDRVLISNPIFVYSPQENEEVVAAVVQVIYNIEGIGLSSSEYYELLLRSLLLILLIGALFYFSFTHLTSIEFKKMHNEIESASKKGYHHLELRTKFEEAKNIVHSINKIFKKTRELISNLPEELRKKESHIENTDEILRQLLQALPDGIAILNDSYQVILYNEAFQKIAMTKKMDIQEKSILDVIQNQRLLQNISLSLGQAAQGRMVTEELQSGEQSYSLSVSASRTPGNEIDFYILKIRQVTA
jgi:pSer/pThr/pTyr-binding forkhead associated (FHA) protein